MTFSPELLLFFIWQVVGDIYVWIAAGIGGALFMLLLLIWIRQILNRGLT